MNKRLKKKAARAKREKIHALLDTVPDINGLLPRKRDGKIRKREENTEWQM